MSQIAFRSQIYGKTGNIYFLQVGTDGPIKIGFTKSDVKNRVRAHQAGSPHILRWIGYFEGTRSDERQTHLLLANSWHRAEWFYPTVEVLAFVRQKTPEDFVPIAAEAPAFPLLWRRRGVTTPWVRA